ncbi:LppX_LprAFG lipoprotein [Nocardioides agariphilus]|uniref:LppX_LprAFG lipoprotein n=1 Tax=Nocardioides agariphilus TaxID=433664 RepID=A0A930YGC5_9ACTN|nr:LppX_LprAFG lipoprotein [Nocardioides agariphilus]
MTKRTWMGVVPALVLALGASVSACGGDDSGSKSGAKTPEDVFSAAQARLTVTPGVNLTLETKDLPEGINGIQKAEGTATDAPAFEGSLTVTLSGQAFEVPVVGVDDLVCAQIPLTPGWSDVDPADYGAPDPAGFLSPDNGFAAILGAATDLEKNESIRGGADNNEILTKYTGTVPGEVVAKVIPGASGDFGLTAQITDDDELRELALTGVFYPDADANTYTVGFDDYGTTKDIQAPCDPV